MLCGIGSKTEETIIPAAETPKAAVEFTASEAAENPVETEEEALAAEATPAAPEEEDKAPAEAEKSPAPAENPAEADADTPAAEAPAAAAPEADAPAEVIPEPEEAPAEETPAAEAPEPKEAPSAEAPAEEAPASEAPSAEAPAEEAPAAEAPAEELPAEEAREPEEAMAAEAEEEEPVGAPIKWQALEKKEEMLPSKVGAPIKWQAPAEKEEEAAPAEAPEEKRESPSRRKFVPPPLSKMTLAQQQSMKDILAIPENLKRRVGFKPLKDGEKIGFSLDPHSTAVRRVIDNTQAYWKGVKPDWNVLSVNEVPIDVNTVKPSIKGAIAEKQEFCILFEMDKPFKPKVGKMASAARRR